MITSQLTVNTKSSLHYWQQLSNMAAMSSGVLTGGGVGEKVLSGPAKPTARTLWLSLEGGELKLNSCFLSEGGHDARLNHAVG